MRPPLSILASHAKHRGGTWEIWRQGTKHRVVILRVRGLLVLSRDYGSADFAPADEKFYPRTTFRPLTAGCEPVPWQVVLEAAAADLGFIDHRLQRSEQRTSGELVEAFTLAALGVPKSIDLAALERAYLKGWDRRAGHVLGGRTTAGWGCATQPPPRGAAHYGERVRWAREARNMGQRELGRALDRSRGAIRGIEQGCVALARIEKIARVLDVDPAWLAFGTGEAPAKR